MSYIALKSIQQCLEVLNVRIGDRNRHRWARGIASSLVVELHADTAQIGGNTLNFLLLPGLFGLSKLLALAGRGKERRHCGLEELTKEEILISRAYLIGWGLERQLAG